MNGILLYPSKKIKNKNTKFKITPSKIREERNVYFKQYKM